MNELLTVKGLTEYLNISHKTIYIWRSQGCPAEIDTPLRFDAKKVVYWLKHDRPKILKRLRAEAREREKNQDPTIRRINRRTKDQ